MSPAMNQSSLFNFKYAQILSEPHWTAVTGRQTTFKNNIRKSPWRVIGRITNKRNIQPKTILKADMSNLSEVQSISRIFIDRKGKLTLQKLTGKNKFKIFFLFKTHSAMNQSTVFQGEPNG